MLIYSVRMSKNLLGRKTGKLRKIKEVLKNVTASASKTDQHAQQKEVTVLLLNS